ncbi:uncharacterized protein PRCAT00004636001 [Priceomyces carsonii]|uniref:uncharacterized protein n=1 Tax=Priceomyces carsonii TaxID=28549 RepID=UPI002ED852EE|nr:unnamed protein product [Priceomyces carsonii]
MSDTATEKSAGSGASKSSTKLGKFTTGESWVSPFRTSSLSKKNLHKQYVQDNSINRIHVPKKFASHPTLEAQKKVKEETPESGGAKEDLLEKTESKVDAGEEAEDEAKEEDKEEGEEEGKKEDESADEDEPKAIADEVASKTGTSDIGSVADDAENKETVSKAAVDKVEPVGEKNTEADDELSKEPEETTVADSAPDDNLQEKIKNAPIELVTQPSFKYEPVTEPDQKVLQEFQDKPALLAHYQELSATAIGSASRALDDPNKVIDLGSGMKMTQQQLLDIAAARVAPVIANINEQVDKTRTEDEIKRQDELATKVKAQEKKLTSDYEKYKKKVEKQKAKFNKDIEDKLAELAKKTKSAETAATNFEKTTKEEISEADSEFKKREAEAVEKHSTDKENLIKNHEELEATKKQDLEDAKANQETITQEIEELQEKKTALDNDNSELSTKIEELTSELNEKTEELSDLKAKHSEKKSLISNNLATKDELDTKIDTAKNELAEKQKKHDELTTEVELLAGTLALFSSKLSTLDNEKKERSRRLSEAKNHYHEWESEKQELAKKVAREHEQQRLEAKEAAETKRVHEELEKERLKREEEAKAEQERIAKEKAEEEERVAKEKAEEEERVAKEKEKEEERIATEQKGRELRTNGPYLEAKSVSLGLATAGLGTSGSSDFEALKQENDRVHKERLQKEENERLKLQEDIAKLKEEKEAWARSEQEESDKLALSKAEEIKKLEAEHEARLAAFRQRLEFEESEMTRLSDEVENLKKIKQLRAEKARLATEISTDGKTDDVQKLIDERELELAMLSKQIKLEREIVDKKHGDKNPFLDSGNELSTSDTGATSKQQLLEPKSEVAKEKGKNKISPPAIIVGSGAGVAAGAAGASASSGSGAKAGTSSKAGQSNGHESSKSNNLFKKLSRRLSKSESGEQRSGSVGAKKDVSDKKVAAKQKSDTSKSGPVSITKQPAGVSGSRRTLNSVASSDYDTYSVYEEVSDAEYEAHKNNPNYMEMSTEELSKKRTPKKV